MTDWIRLVRAVGGLLSIVVLLAGLSAEVIYPEISVSDPTIYVLLVLIGGLLAVDMITDKLPLTITVKGTEEEDDQ